MLPSRQIAQVDIGNVSCIKSEPSQPTQLKILRRPRPDNRTDPNSTNYDSQSGPDERFHRIRHVAQSKNSHLEDDNEWPTLADAITLKDTGSQKMYSTVSRNGVEMKNLDKCSSSQQTDAAIVAQSKHDQPMPIRPTPNPSQVASITTRLKSYQERADDYAKARMRIFGSAPTIEDNQPVESRVNNI